MSMSIVTGQTASATAIAGTVTCTLPNAPTVGNLLVLCTGNSGFGISTSVGSTFTKAIDKLTDSVTYSSIWYKIATGSETAVVVTASSGTPLIDSYYMELQGNASSLVLDQTGSVAESNAATQTITTSGSTVQNDEYAVVATMHNGAGSTVAFNNSFTAQYTADGTYNRFFVGVKILAASGSISTTQTQAQTLFQNGVIATFKANAGVAQTRTVGGFTTASLVTT